VHQQGKEQVKFFYNFFLLGRARFEGGSGKFSSYSMCRQLKKVINFFRKKVHSRENPGYAYVSR